MTLPGLRCIRYGEAMGKKLREILGELRRAGFVEVPGKGSHRKFVHPSFRGALTISGGAGDDAKPYQLKAVQMALREIEHEEE